MSNRETEDKEGGQNGSWEMNRGGGGSRGGRRRRKRADWVEGMTANERRMWEGEEKERKKKQKEGGGGK